MRPLVIAHRGASFIAPENTLSAFRAAATIGADGFETDVQLTKDGRMVIHHNYTIDANSNGSGNIIDMTEEELRQYDFGIHKGPEFAGEKIPTLAECLAATAPFRMVNIELKPPVDRTIPYVKPVAEAIKSAGLVDKIIISSFDHSLLKEMKEILPEIRVGALTDAPLKEGEESGIDPVRLAQQNLDTYVEGLDFELNYLHCEYHSLLQDPSLVEKMHARGIGVNPWTPDDPEELKALIAMGTDGIITNRPDILMELLKDN